MVFLFILIIFLFLIMFSKIKLKIINFKFSSQRKQHLNEDYKFIIRLYVLGKIPILKISITKAKLEKLKINQKIKNFNFNLIEDNNNFDKKILDIIKEMKINIDKINLNIEIGTESAILTSIIVPALSTFLAIMLSKKVEKFENQIFIINPIYNNENLINIVFSGIFEIKMIHIINIIYILNKKEGVRKYERTSNRRSYDYGYE